MKIISNMDLHPYLRGPTEWWDLVDLVEYGGSW